MAVDGLGPTERANDLKLTRCVVEMIGTTKDMRYPSIVIIHHNGEHIGWRAITPEEDHVVQLIVLKTHVTQHDVFHNCFAGLLGLQANDKRGTLRSLAGITVPPAAVVAN